VLASCAPGPSYPNRSVGPIPEAPFSDARSQGVETRLILGQEVRVTVGSFPPFVGTVQLMTGSELRLRTDLREVPFRFASIRTLEVRRRRRTLAVELSLLGVVAGGILGRVTLLGLGGSHWESQGRLLAPGLGAIAGGLLGALFGWQLSGDYWDPIPVPMTIR
jgi:hypothetical protein